MNAGDQAEQDLMGNAEVAAYLGVSRQRVLQLAARDDFPRPVAVLKMGQVWQSDSIRAWAGARRPPARQDRAQAPDGDA